jgi:hypothetical protein
MLTPEDLEAAAAIAEAAPEFSEAQMARLAILLNPSEGGDTPAAAA